MADKNRYEHIHILVNRKKEKDIIDFFDMQYNKSDSIRILIKDFISKFGSIDVSGVTSLNYKCRKEQKD